MTSAPLARADDFCTAYDLDIPVLLAPMAGACPPDLSIAVANAGGMGACGCLLMQPDAIADWTWEVRAATNGGFQLNIWIPDPAPERDAAHEAKVRDFLGGWGPIVDAAAGDAALPDFEAQVAAMIEAGPSVISTIMGVFDTKTVATLKDNGIRWFATVTTVAEAVEAVAAGADCVVAQGSEAGGHRGAFEAGNADARAIGLFALLPAVVDAVEVPVIATGGIGDARGAAAAFMLGASAVQIGTGFLRSPESGIPEVWRARLADTRPEDTALTRAFSGRLGRALATDYVRAANAPDAPAPAPYPVQRGLRAPMQADALETNDIERLQAWAGQSAALGTADPASDKARALWADTKALLGG